jgi:hypothetical protein
MVMLHQSPRDVAAHAAQPDDANFHMLLRLFFRWIVMLAVLRHPPFRASRNRL